MMDAATSMSSSSMGHLNMSSTSNITSYMTLSPKDLIIVIPRMLTRASSFAFTTVPDRIDSMLGLSNGGRVIAEATGNGTNRIFTTTLPQTSAGVNGGASAGAVAPRIFSSMTFQQVRNFGGIFTYVTSKWALACFTLAIILNRTQIYASARRHITLTWPLRLALRVVPILMFLSHTITLLQAMRCQTSPQYSFMKYGSADKHVDLEFSGDGGILYWISSTLLFWQADAEACLAVGMIPSKAEVWDRTGSLSFLWPFFQSLCLGQFVETISCAISGRTLRTETGMSIFEHSLAFAEAEATISNQFGLSPFGSPRGSLSTSAPSNSNQTSGYELVTKSMLLQQLNTPPEVLLMGIISSLNNLSSQILGLLNMQARFRLLNTGVWGLCFMSAFVWGFFSFRPESAPDAIILRFPTVCIVGFIPHLLILLGILLCASIYSLALLLCFLSPPTDRPPPQSLKERFRLARENMQANAQLSSIRLDMQEDFYTALLKIGFSALTIASEAVFLNEGQRIAVAQWTWLEEARMKEVEAFQQSYDPTRRIKIDWQGPRADEPANLGSPRPWTSGYDRGVSMKAVRASPGQSVRRGGGDGVGHMQRGGRYFMAYEFFEGIFWLFVGWLKLLTNKLLDKVGIIRRPQWLRSSKRKEGVHNKQDGIVQTPLPDSLDFWLLSDEGVLSLPENDDVDVEYETKRRHKLVNDRWGEAEEQNLNSTLYEWWKHGGWWGEKDESGSYQAPSQEDDDTTSVVSISTEAESETDSENGWENANNDDDDDDDVMSIDSFPSTPTQRHPIPSHSHHRSLSHSSGLLNDHALDPHHLAQLLDPKDPTTRSEARMLAHHLTSPTITTRSRYAHAQSFASAKLLTSTRYRPANNTIPASGPLSPDEEAQLLEHLILTRRSNASSDFSHSNTADSGGMNWREGATGMGQGGPQCVVCQSAPRTVLAWPCRCLSLCDECRVSLAMNNFGTCVCCRQDVVGFSRLFVP